MSNAESGDPKVNVQISFTNFLKNSVELTGVKKSGIQPTTVIVTVVIVTVELNTLVLK